MNRYLKERDEARNAGDVLAKAVLDHLMINFDENLAKALIKYANFSDNKMLQLKMGLITA